MTEQEIEILARAVADKLSSGRGSHPLDRSSVYPPIVSSAHPLIRPERRTPASIRVADFIDHTLLKAEATRGEIEKLCAEAKQHRFAAVCVNGCWVARCTELLRGTGVKVAAVAGFPLGAMTSG